MAIVKRRNIGASEKDASRKVSGWLTYGERTQDKEFKGTIDASSGSIVISGNSILETYNSTNDRYYDRKGSHLKLSISASAEELLALSQVLAKAALEKQRAETAQYKKWYNESKAEKEDLENQVEALKRAFKAAD